MIERPHCQVGLADLAPSWATARDRDSYEIGLCALLAGLLGSDT